MRTGISNLDWAKALPDAIENYKNTSLRQKDPCPRNNCGKKRTKNHQNTLSIQGLCLILQKNIKKIENANYFSINVIEKRNESMNETKF
jgi:hypothetical protein